MSSAVSPMGKRYDEELGSYKAKCLSTYSDHTMAAMVEA